MNDDMKVDVMGLFETAAWLGGTMVVAGVAAFLFGAEPVAAVAIGFVFPLALASIIGVFGGLFALYATMSEYALKRIDRNWEAKAQLVNRRLEAAVYRWQIREFGFGSKAFSISVSRRGESVKFGRFYAENDTDPFDFDGSDEEFQQAYDARAKAVETLVPSAEAKERLHRDLGAVLSRNLDLELKRALIRHGRLHVDTTFPF